ncbi:MAG: hypothetical protein GY707_17005 [Desulfobacteraceae bacterium]|nr:hypothetical protein [Desulfobacteraceae bacterium]
MKYLYTIVFAVFFSFNSYATQRAHNNYIYNSLNFSFCYNLTAYDSVEYLYYKGLSSVLNKYIIDKAEKSGLNNKKFEIQAGCTIFGGHPSIEISRNKNSNFVFIHGDIDLYRLVRIINYFSSNDWESFCYDSNLVDSKTAIKTFNTILDHRVGRPQLDFFKNKKTIVWELSDLKIIYEHDDLHFQFKENKLDFKIDSPLPVKLGDRYFFVTNNIVQVFESGEILLEQRIPGFDDTKPYRYSMKAYKDWVNLYYEEKPVLSYSFTENKFYKINRRAQKKYEAGS